MDKQQKNILELIHTSYFQFTAAEQRIADFVLAQYEQVQFMEKIRFFHPKRKTNSAPALASELASNKA